MTTPSYNENYVTRQEFDEFRSDVYYRFDDLKDYVRTGFGKMEEYMDNRFVELETKLEKNKKEILFEIKGYIDNALKR